jgi:hypothetical protein
MTTLLRAIHGVLKKSAGLINSVIEQARKLRNEAQRSPVDNALERAVAEIPTPDYELLRDRKSGLTFREIAKKRGMTEADALQSLARLYADIRMRTMPGDAPPGKDHVDPKRGEAA